MRPILPLTFEVPVLGYEIILQSKAVLKLCRKLTISNELGLHARAAAQIARLAEQARARVYIIKDGQETDATSILDVIGLYCPQGTEVTVKIIDPADVKILDSIANLIETGFGEL